MAAFVWFSQDHIERDGETRSDQEHFEHEVVECANEKRNPCLGYEWWSLVVTKLFCPLNKVVANQTNLRVDFQLLADPLNAYTHVKKGVAYHRVR
jgi:hypothetical protein